MLCIALLLVRYCVHGHMQCSLTAVVLNAMNNFRSAAGTALLWWIEKLCPWTFAPSQYSTDSELSYSWQPIPKRPTPHCKYMPQTNHARHNTNLMFDLHIKASLFHDQTISSPSMFNSLLIDEWRGAPVGCFSVIKLVHSCAWSCSPMCVSCFLECLNKHCALVMTITRSLLYLCSSVARRQGGV